MLHEDNIFKSMKDIKFEDTVSHQCGCDDERQRRGARHRGRHEPARSYHGHVHAGDDPHRRHRQDGIQMDEISEELGRAMTPHLFEISTSTHYGRMVMTDDNTVMLFGDMNEMMKYIV